jgi:redox-sensitive bicupin YhaK (pirin superfamily)
MVLLYAELFPIKCRKWFGPFIFWDHMGPVTLEGDKELKVRSHPHIGLATITYLFSGEILHRDSLGNEQYIRPGEVNWMTAGRGIVHSERARFEKPTELEGIQLWLALPKESQEVDPSFVHCKEEELPSLTLNDVSFKLIAGSFADGESPIKVYSELFYLTAHASKGDKFQYQLPAHHEAAIYVIDGDVEVAGQSFKRFDMITFKQGSELDVTFGSNAQIMLLGGRAIS